MNSVILVNPFFRKKNDFSNEPKNTLLQMADLMVQLSQILAKQGKKRYTKNLPKISSILTKKVQI